MYKQLKVVTLYKNQLIGFKIMLVKELKTINNSKAAR